MADSDPGTVDSVPLSTNIEAPPDTLQPRAQLKRTASAASLTGALDPSRKRMKEEGSEHDSQSSAGDALTGGNITEELVEQLTLELQCGCCSSLVYRPVLVHPCQHFFCGSCCVLWIRNGGTNCPACRGLSTTVTPFRPLQTILDLLLRAAPQKARTERERQQADEIYSGTSMRIPAPRELSPEPDINPSDYARPCPTCLPGNAYGWNCPQPIVDPNIDPDHAWLLDDGSPPGHALCGNCENLLALASPMTSKCDFCQVSFCGITAQGRCVATTLLSQQLHELHDLGDMIQSAKVYEAFCSNTVEVDIMLDYLTTQRMTPRHIYQDIVTHIQAQPRGFLPLVEQELFVDVHPLPAGIDPDPQAPRNKICRGCAAEVFFYGLRDWFLRERAKGFLEEAILGKKNCENGAECTRQGELEHAREFNHMVPFVGSPSHTGEVAAVNPLPASAPPAPENTSDDDDEEEADVILNMGEVDLSFESDVLPTPPAQATTIPSASGPEEDQEMLDA
ncbi:RING-type domain-containing protein [Mycena indigotica]|uniref:RING-type domain-containing protein n=1 Tax=Mycena indigotica TaxID=2126181 RepID=A0A8H6W4E4_9AGAR|nr:RING-type domain-containing protein [Mycena indigotica]KAF7298869.1 RING-type domain-containing protein [Mycena indigotica]